MAKINETKSTKSNIITFLIIMVINRNGINNIKKEVLLTTADLIRTHNQDQEADLILKTDRVGRELGLTKGLILKLISSQ